MHPTRLKKLIDTAKLVEKFGPDVSGESQEQFIEAAMTRAEYLKKSTETREQAFARLSMQDADIRSLMKAARCSEPSAPAANPVQKTATEQDAENRLARLANDHATNNGISFAQAFSEVTKAGEGRELLKKSRSL